ncbi:hypothetical protein SAMN04515667_1028 [Formosa sp. Hel1_31_208]|uniref:hypothetical protein n=1 Tax=Formosa sp. Hel1_31_208 TaxID=1798225 RepID=UPI00087D29EE|nr:hypothetical protein [Formosa sp. Hel1_31_208]SDR93497.1 hypothetical protein SAMN04515667_1028 [Formosa sp. Hel1_31_208]
MKQESKPWTKAELEIYILILCANADSVETKHEIELIKSRTDAKTFEKMYLEYSEDGEQESLDKIDENIQLHDFSDMELADFRRDIYELFLSDGVMDRKESNIDRILDNILY